MGTAPHNSFKPTAILLVTLLLTAIWFSLPHAQGQDEPDADAPVTLTSAMVPGVGDTHFVPNPMSLAGGGTLEVQKSAQIPGNKIRIRQVVRWSDADAATFAPIGELIIDRFDDLGNRKLSLDEIQSTLSSAGVNLSQVRFCGATSCLVTRTGEPEPPATATAATLDPHAVVQQWIDQGNKAAAATQPVQNTVNGTDIADAECTPFHSLRDRALIDLSQRLNLPVDQLQVTFNPKDRAMLNLSEPMFRFQLDPHRVHDLGQVSWDVTIMSGETQQKLLLIADARCWQHEFVMVKGIIYKQVLQDNDIAERRVLVDHIPDDQVLIRNQIVGQQAARDLKPGVVLTARLIDPVPLARPGQVLTITLNQGGVQVTTGGVAMETGSFGQTIKVKSDRTQDVFEATLTGPQTASVSPVSTEINVASSVGN